MCNYGGPSRVSRNDYAEQGELVYRLVENYVDLPKFVRKPLWRLWHNLIITWEKENVVMRFMNYGYAPTEDDAQQLELLPADESERYSIQLYDHGARQTEIEGKEVLEVGCGRGGGASYITRYMHPKSYTGVDLSTSGINFCNSFYRIPELNFIRGDAEDLPIEDDSMDVVVNVESSRCYGNIMEFFSEVKRVLRSDGTFVLVDMRWAEDVPELKRQVQEAGFVIDSEENISPNVVRALELDADRRDRLIRQKVPKFLNKAFGEFAGVRGSERYESFASGRMQYWCFTLKPSI